MKKSSIIKINDRTKAIVSNQGILRLHWLPEALQGGILGHRPKAPFPDRQHTKPWHFEHRSITDSCSNEQERTTGAPATENTTPQPQQITPVCC